MKELNGVEVLEHLKDAKGAMVKVSYINLITDVYYNEDDLRDNKPINKEQFIPLDYEYRDNCHNLYGAFPSDLCIQEVIIGIAEDSVKGWLNDYGRLYIIDIEDKLPKVNDNKKYRVKELTAFNYKAVHIETGKVFVACYSETFDEKGKLIDITAKPYEQMLNLLQEEVWYYGTDDADDYEPLIETEGFEFRLGEDILRKCMIGSESVWEQLRKSYEITNEGR